MATKKKIWKKTTKFTVIRDSIRLLFFLNFYLLMKILKVDFEIESEYIVLLSILFLGPFFCGWLCPFGAASYFMLKIRRQIFPKWEYQFPPQLDKFIRYLRYILLLYFIALFVIKGVDYFGNHIVMYKSTTFSYYFIKFKHIAVILISMFIPYFFCKYLCWQKAAYNLISGFLFKTTKIKRDTNTCITCKKCNKVCPMSIPIASKKSVSGNDCFSCYNCLDTDICPEKHKSLFLYWFGIKVNKNIFALCAFLFYISVTIYVLYGI